MSASSKKKLRNQLAAEKMTERQLAEQKEAKKLKLYTAAFAIVIALLLVVALWVGISTAVTNSGILAKNTTALTIGEHELSNAELNYYYIDAVNQFYSQYGSYAAMFGLDATAPLDQQVLDEATGYTWADDFVLAATENARAVYAMCSAAEAAGFTLPEEDQTELDNMLYQTELYAVYYYGYADVDTYLKAMYGNGAGMETYRTYCEMTYLADAYYAYYAENLSFEESDLRAAEAENYHNYSLFSYNYYYVDASRYLTGGTTAEDGTVTYTQEEKEAAVAAAEQDAIALTADTINTKEELDAAIGALSVNAGSETAAASTAISNYAYSSVPAVISQWMSEDGRVEADRAYLANETTVTNEDGTETTAANGYYVVYYIGINDNNYAMPSVRHILVPFQSAESAEDETTAAEPTEEDKANAKKTATAILADWISGEASEASFAELANLKSTDEGSNTNGGLYENIALGQMVEPFEAWCFDESRQYGDFDIVETTYGYHIMFYAGASEETYRDTLIENDLLNQNLTEWYTAIVDSISVTEGNTKYLSKDLIISAG